MKTAIFTILFTITVCGGAALVGLHGQKAAEQKAFNEHMDTVLMPVTSVAPVVKDDAQEKFNADLDKLLGFEHRPTPVKPMVSTKAAKVIAEWATN
jgi:hypothetical protein